MNKAKVVLASGLVIRIPHEPLAAMLLLEAIAEINKGGIFIKVDKTTREGILSIRFSQGNCGRDTYEFVRDYNNANLPEA